MQSHGNFIGSPATGLAGTLAPSISVACRMAVDSYRQQRTMRWDAVKEEVV